MSTILIKAAKANNKLLADLAKKLGGNILNVDDDQFEDFMLGNLTESVKTGKTVSKTTILKN